MTITSGKLYETSSNRNVVVNVALAHEFERLVRLHRLQHEAQVESATPLPPEVQANVQVSLIRTYGPEFEHVVCRKPFVDWGHAGKGGEFRLQTAALKQGWQH